VPQRYNTKSTYDTALRLAGVLTLLFVFLVGIKGLGLGFKLLGQDLLSSFIIATQNPFVGLMVGIVCTTLLQSSSVSTSMIVGLVAAPDNALPIANAIPMIMGANIGTTVTNTIVSLGHMQRKNEFLRAFSVATCHDFFNYLTVLILLPLELATGVMEKSAVFLSQFLAGSVPGVSYKSPLKSAIKAGLGPLKALGESLFDSHTGQACVLIVASAVMIFVALLLVVKLMRSLMQAKVETIVRRSVGLNVLVAMFVGAIATIMVQSSSITTSLLVPLAGAGLISLRGAFPITLGANIGTTVTALLASLGASGPNAQFGVTIALVHLLFNVAGILVIYPIPTVRQLPLRAAEALARAALRSKKWAIFYIVMMFYVAPMLLIFLTKL
jgi:solute carrier family 34 (sodium-dependent phosphate cotransporter)